MPPGRTPTVLHKPRGPQRVNGEGEKRLSQGDNSASDENPPCRKKEEEAGGVGAKGGLRALLKNRLDFLEQCQE